MTCSDFKNCVAKCEDVTLAETAACANHVMECRDCFRFIRKQKGGMGEGEYEELILKLTSDPEIKLSRKVMRRL